MEKSTSSSVAGEEDSSITLTPSIIQGKAYRFSSVVNEDQLAAVFAKQIIHEDATAIDSTVNESRILDLEDSRADFGMSQDAKLKAYKDSVGVEVQVSQSETGRAGGDLFEKLVYSKVKLVKSAAAGNKMLQMRKAFWLYPLEEGKISAELKDESDILTSFVFDQGSMLAKKKTISEPLAFIQNFFANYRASKTSKFTFMLNKNTQEETYKNPYNLRGNRYFFAYLFEDFEGTSSKDSVDNETCFLQPCHTLFLIESRYPFRKLFFAVLSRLFEIVRLRRLEKYACNFNGNENDQENLKTMKQYDATVIHEVVTYHRRSSSAAARHFLKTFIKSDCKMALVSLTRFSNKI